MMSILAGPTRSRSGSPSRRVILRSECAAPVGLRLAWPASVSGYCLAVDGVKTPLSSISPTTSLRAANCPCRWPSPTGSPSYQRTVASAPFPTVSPVRLSPNRTGGRTTASGRRSPRTSSTPRRTPRGGGSRGGQRRSVEGEPGGTGLRLDDRRRSILIGEVAVDGVCLEAIGQPDSSCFAHFESVSSLPNGVSAVIRCFSFRFAAPQ